MAKEFISSTQSHLPIGEIKEGTVVMKDTSLRGVILVSSLNFALKSDEEKDAIIYSFQNFLNSLDFSIQIVANSRKLDLSTYLNSVKQEATKVKSPLIKLQADEYIAFVNSLLENANIMEKRFFVVVPYYPAGIDDLPGVANLIKQKKQTPGGNFDEHKKGLLLRMEEIINGINSIGLRAASLGTEDLLELYYSLYNPETSSNQKMISLDNINQEPVIQGGQDGAI